MVKTIKRLCDEHNESLRQVELALGFSTGSICRWDENKPSVDRVQKVAEHFGVTVDYILNGPQEEPGDS